MSTPIVEVNIYPIVIVSIGPFAISIFLLKKQEY